MLYHHSRSENRTVAAEFRISAGRPMALLGACPAYQPTPLRDAPELAAQLGLARLWIKDETARMRLGSFKALGGAFAVVQMILDRADVADPISQAARGTAKTMTFVTASAGNHGLSVASGARIFGARAKIVLSASVPEAFANRIRATSAEVIRITGSYEDSVQEAVRRATAHDWIHLADGSWEGYTAAPALVMEGYTVLAEEARCSFLDSGGWPSHVLLQAGVGGLAAACAAHIRTFWDQQPEIIVVEPAAAPCLMESMRAGHLVRTPGPVSNMGRLDCKDASLLAFQTLQQDADTFVTVTDEQAQAAVGTLALAGVHSTPSGAAAIAAIPLLGLPPEARCMIIASEGPEGH